MQRPRPLVLVGLGLLALVAGLVGWRWWAHTQALEVQQARATREFAPVLEKLQAPAAPAAPPDLDATIRVIHEIDGAIATSGSLGDYLQAMARHDYRGVDPQVLAARRELMGVLFEIYAVQAEQEEQEEMWGLTSELLLSTLSVVGGEGNLTPIGPVGSVQVDREQARALLQQIQERQEARLELGREERDLEGRLLDALVSYADVYHRTVSDWDRLCTVRDRAYLAVHNGDWGTAQAAAAEAIALAPQEREAHLLQVLAMIEGGDIGDAERADEARALLAQAMQDHPDQSAPAFLLLGVLESRLGNPEAATLALQQAAAYYPKQADALADMLDPYRARSFLRKTREGSYVIELYKGTMLGAGYFSPDLQMARMSFQRGDVQGGRAKVLDHFSRRRAQAQWDFLLSDIDFAQALLGEDFRAIFPEDAYLDLVVKPGLVGSRLDVALDNRSDRTLHNATLVLALHLTDMHPDDYETLVAGPTVPAVKAHDRTSFGDVEVKLDLWGQEKGVQDIVTHRAILVADEAVLWVDTDAYKIAEAEEFRRSPDTLARADAQARAAVAGGGSRYGLVERLVEDARTGTSLQVDTKALLKDGVTITVPKELAVLRPLFRLQYGDQVFTADEDLIVGDQIQLSFDGVEDFEGRAETLQLVASTVLGDLVWTWGPDGGSRFRLIQVTEQR